MSQGWLVFSLCLQSAIGILPHPALATQTYIDSVPQGAASRDLYSTLSWTSFEACWPPPIVLYLRKDLDAHIFSIALEPGYYTWLNVS